MSLQEGFRPVSCGLPGLEAGQSAFLPEVIEQYFVEDTVVEVLATCILRKGRPDVVNMKIPEYKVLKAAMRIEEKQ